jgi:UPF0271 protein
MGVTKLDLNCDLGEGEPLARTRALMRWITSANVACGGHAGDLRTMKACVRLARECGVRLGAHPGAWARGDFGRGDVHLTSDELDLLLLHQVGALERLAVANGVRLHHVKLHGALYHAVESDPALGRRYAATVRRWWPKAIIYSRAGGVVARLAVEAGVRVWEEGFADRGYADDGTLLARGQPGALLTDVDEVIRRVKTILESGEIVTASGRRLPLRPQTLCVHSDTPGAVSLARVAAEMSGHGRGNGARKSQPRAT